MEQDRFQKNHTVFIIGMISLVISLILLALCLYLLPNLLFGWQYDIPPFVPYINEWLISTYNFTDSSASKVLFFILVGLSLVFIAIAYFSSNRIENQIYQDEFEETEIPIKSKEESTEGRSLVFKILLFIFVVFIIGALFQWLIYSSTPEEISQNNPYNGINGKTIEGT